MTTTKLLARVRKEHVPCQRPPAMFQLGHISYISLIISVLQIFWGPYPFAVWSDVSQAGLNLCHKLSFPHARKWHIPATRSDRTGTPFQYYFAMRNLRRNPGMQISRLAIFWTPFRRMLFPGSSPSGTKSEFQFRTKNLRAKFNSGEFRFPQGKAFKRRRVAFES